MTPARRQLLLAGALVLLFLLHDDAWLWDDPRIVLGLPVGMTWHALYCLAASVLMALLVRHAWPAHLDVQTGDGGEPRR